MPPANAPSNVRKQATYAARRSRTAPAPAKAPEPEHETLEEDEADPSEVRRHIATARRNLDPDHQIRRAMDAFLSPTRPNDNGSN